MLERIIDIALKRRMLVLSVAMAVGALGIYNYQHLPIDAVPDITNVQVQINTEARILSAGNGKPRYVSDRDGHGRVASARLHAFGLTLWPVAGYRRFRGRDKRVFCPAVDQ
jgi:hypothetical protein